MRDNRVPCCVAVVGFLAVWCLAGCGRGGDEAAAHAPKNIVIVCVNCLRKASVGIYSGAGHTPHIDAFAESGAFVFNNLVVPATWSDPCLYELFTSRDFRRAPDRIAAAFHMDTVITNPEAILPETLLRCGAMHVAGETEYDHLWVYHRRLRDVPKMLQVRQLKPPFVLFVHATSLHIPYATANGTAEARDADLGGVPPSVRQHYLDALETFSQRDEIQDEGIIPAMPFLLAGFGPYRWIDTPLGRKHKINYGWLVNEQVLSAWRGSPAYPVEIDILRRLYDGNVRTLDADFAQLLGYLEQCGVLDKTIVVLMGDHGEHLMQHGRMEHWMPYDEIINVPLIIKVPGMRDKKMVIEDQVRTRDILPTLLDLAGVRIAEAATASVDGRSLTGLLNGERIDITAFSRSEHTSHGVRRNDGWKLIWHRNTGKKELYNVKADPTESKDLAGLRPDIQALLEEELLLHVYDRP